MITAVGGPHDWAGALLVARQQGALVEQPLHNGQVAIQRGVDQRRVVVVVVGVDVRAVPVQPLRDLQLAAQHRVVQQRVALAAHIMHRAPVLQQVLHLPQKQ